MTTIQMKPAVLRQKETDGAPTSAARMYEDCDFSAADLRSYIQNFQRAAEPAAPTVEPDTKPDTTPDTTPVPRPDEAPEHVPGTQPTPDADPVPDQCPIRR